MINHITALETLAAQLVDELTAVKQLVNGHYESQAEQQEPTPNEQRKVIIEKAKQFVESAIERGRDSDAIKGDAGNKTYKAHFYTIEFFTKENKITALVTRTNKYGRNVKSQPEHVGRAKCSPSDVFNEHIGKAIALGRALELDVSEFENAVQPTEFVVGQIVEVFDTFHKQIHVKGELLGVESQGLLNFNEEAYLKYLNYPYKKTSLLPSYKQTIIDDTNAIYKEE